MRKSRSRAQIKSKDKTMAAIVKDKAKAAHKPTTNGCTEWKAEIAGEKIKGPPGTYTRTSAMVAAGERGKRADKFSNNSIELNNSVELNKKNCRNRLSSSSLLQMDHEDLCPFYDSYQRSFGAFPDIDLLSTARKPCETEMNLLSVHNTQETPESTTVALGAAIKDLPRRRLVSASDLSFGSPVRMLRDAPRIWNNPYSTDSASLPARQKPLQQHYQELELRHKELVFQRQKLLAGTKGHNGPTATSIIEANHHQQQQQQQQQQEEEEEEEEEKEKEQNEETSGGATNATADSSSFSFSHASDPQNWLVCQVCNIKAFTSRDDVVAHELTCCPEPQKFEQMAADMYVNPDTISPLEDLGGMYDSPPFQEFVAESFVSDADSYPEETGPFISMKYPMALAMESDKDWLTPLHCYVREHCVEVFTASSIDIARPTRGKRQPIEVGQVGIRCPHCASMRDEGRARGCGSVYYPTSIASVYNATMNLLQRHLDKCSAIPDDIMKRYKILKADDARSGTSKRYWIESSLSFGMVDTPSGIRLSALEPPTFPSLSNQHSLTRIERLNVNYCFTTKNDASNVFNRHGSGTANSSPVDPPEDMRSSSQRCLSPSPERSLTLAAVSSLVRPTDDEYSTGFSFELISQMRRCGFTEADRLGKRKGLPVGFPGLACRHCFGDFGSGRFFPSSIKTLSDTSKTLNVIFNHMKKCRMCPKDTQSKLEKLRQTHDDERGAMKFGSQKAFFTNVWDRIHLDGNPGIMPQTNAPRKKQKTKSLPSPSKESSFLNIPPPPLTTSLFDSDLFVPSL